MNPPNWLLHHETLIRLGAFVSTFVQLRLPFAVARACKADSSPRRLRHVPGWRLVLALSLACAFVSTAGTARAQPPTDANTTGQLAPLLTPLGELNSAWRFVGLPKKNADLPATQFQAAPLQGNQRAVRVSTASSYGTLVHDWKGPATGALHWIWRLDQPLTGGKAPPDLTTKAGDDAALKLCVMFDHPLERVPFFERTQLRLARSLSGEALPAATVCYVWDSAQPAGLRGANPYTQRVRYISLRGSNSPLGQSLAEQRHPVQDYLDLFKNEATPGSVPNVLAVVLGADSDNTASTSRGWLEQVEWVVP